MITEVSAPPGIVVDPTPHPVTVAAGETASVTLRDPVRKSAALSLVKVDADTREPVAGAILMVRRDDDHDGTFETTVATVTSAAHPVTIDGLAAGDYEVTETAPPPGYLPPDSPSQRVSLAWNQTKELTFADVRRPPTDDDLDDRPPDVNGAADHHVDHHSTAVHDRSASPDHHGPAVEHDATSAPAGSRSRRHALGAEPSQDRRRAGLSHRCRGPALPGGSGSAGRR